MGPMQVPAQAYYGAQTARAVENFPVSGLRFPRSFIRALDSGGMVWEGSIEYATLESALQALDEGLAAWMKENGIHE